MSELTHVRITASEAGCEEFSWGLANRVKTGSVASFTVSKACAAEFAEACIDGQPVPDPGVPAAPQPEPPDPEPPAGPPWEFEKVIRTEWNPARTQVIDTIANGGIGRNGAVAAKFIAPDKGISTLSVVPYPGDRTGANYVISVSTSELDWTSPAPETREGFAGVSLFIQCGDSGQSPAVFATLEPGFTYFVNVQAEGQDQSGNDPDMRITLQAIR